MALAGKAPVILNGSEISHILFPNLQRDSVFDLNGKTDLASIADWIQQH